MSYSTPLPPPPTPFAPTVPIAAASPVAPMALITPRAQLNKQTNRLYQVQYLPALLGYMLDNNKHFTINALMTSGKRLSCATLKQVF